MLLSVREAAQLLKVTERQVYRWVDEGEIPFHRAPDQVRFNRTELLEWATDRRLPLSLEAFDADLDPEVERPSLAQALRRGGVHLDVPAADREAALRAAVERTALPPTIEPGFLIDVLVARERSGSSAIGEGLALPHVRQPVVGQGAPATMSVTHLREPVAFGAADGIPVHTVFLLVSPTVKSHLHMVAHLARALHDAAFRAALERRAPTGELAGEAERLEGAALSARGESGAD